MPIQFACPSCARGYSVKDELAGKSAKCGQCGHKMKIPLAVDAAASQPPAPKLAALKPSAPKPNSPNSTVTTSTATTKSPAALKSSAARPATIRPAVAQVAAAPTAKVTAKVAALKAPASDPGTSSWLDEELETARIEAKTKPKAPVSDAGCPSCAGPMMPGAVICVKCGYDTRIRGRRSVEHSDENESESQRSKLGYMGSLLRGSFCSFLAAMLGAIIWAVLAYLTDREFGFVAWGLGGLAGLGMALGHEDDDGTFAGIIAAFMSLIGIVAAKVFIVVIFIAAAVSTMVSEIEVEQAAQAFGGAAEIERSALATSLALQELEAGGESLASVDEARFEAALAKSRAAVAELTPEEVKTRLNELGEEHGLEGELADSEPAEFEDKLDEDEAAEFEDDDFETADADIDDANFEEPGEDVTFGSVVGSLFGPMDGLFILLAFFTAYKVGAGQSDD